VIFPAGFYYSFSPEATAQQSNSYNNRGVPYIVLSLSRNIPILMMEGDIVDASSYNEADTHNRIDAFIEAIEAAKRKR
jgi:hypothetical protein